MRRGKMREKEKEKELAQLCLLFHTLLYFILLLLQNDYEYLSTLPY